MKIAVIICEYNPLQKGHVYHIRNTIENCACDKIVCVMSGNFVQRGEAAVADKYTRAEWAVANGADCVIELPPQYSLTTAKYFALGAVKTANKIKGEKILSFGSEEGDLDSLYEAVNFDENEEFKTLFESFMSQGNGYAKSYSLALESFSPKLARLLSSPNNTLAKEYLLAIKMTDSDIKPYTIKRIGGYNDTELCEGYLSASGVRLALRENELPKIADCVPTDVYRYLQDTPADFSKRTGDRLLAILKYTFDKTKAKNAHGVKEGIENRIAESLSDAEDFDSLVSAIATRRYTDAYIRRTLLNIALDNTATKDDLIFSVPNFVNVLAIAEDSKELLSQFACPVTTRGSQIPSDSLISKCDSLYSSIAGEFQKTMRIVKKLR